jgi:zinc protease
MEPKSQVRIIFTGPFEWSQENRYLLNSLADVMNIKLREELREEKGGTYGVGVGGSAERDPKPVYRLAVSFGCAPERLDELIATAFDEIDSVRRFGVGDEYIAKVKETQRREQETRQKQNRFWLSNLEYYLSHGEDPMRILAYPALVEGLTARKIREAAVHYFDLKNYVKVTMVPR